MASTIIATGSKTIIDLSDGKSLSVYLGSNRPRTQIKDVNTSPATFTPNWAGSPYLVITPVIYANQEFIPLTKSGLSVSYRRKEGNDTSTDGQALTSGETENNKTLTVNTNKLDTASGNLITYIASVTYNDPDTGVPINAKAEISFALVTTGLNGDDAKFAWISGEQVFKYTTNGANPFPAQITLEANVQGVTVSQWKYKSGDTWVDYPTSTDNPKTDGTTLIVKPSEAVFTNNVAIIKLVTSDANISDTTSVYKITDGAQGQAAPTVFLTNENITFAGNVNGQIAATTKTCNVVAYSGTTKVTPTIGTITGMPDGMTVTPDTAASNEIPLRISVAANSTFGDAGQLNGVINVPVTSPIKTTLQIQWSKVNTGATGAPAYILTVYAPGGTVFTNGKANGGTSLTINAQFFKGSTDLTNSSNAKYTWEKYASGSWTTVKAEAAGSNGNSLTVNASDVVGSAAYRCKAREGNSTTYFYDTVTIIDKTDNYQAEIDSTAGDVFKNTKGQTCLICRLWQNGQEVDPLKSTTYSTTAPSSPATGAFYYQIQSSGATTKLMRYTGSKWEDATSDATYKHEKTYTWYRRDKDGEPMDDGNAFANGKVIYVDGDDVDVKTVFVCEVE